MLIAGVDEAGRGPLAGPVVAAAVALRPGQALPGVTDSKRLTPARREALYELIVTEACAWSVAGASVAEIDALNILQASMLAMRRAVEGLGLGPEAFSAIRIDGNRQPDFAPGYAVKAETVVRGDASCVAIGAASILAKVTRDRQMQALDAQYPGYGFAAHKGYPTAAHLAALNRLGATPIHRMSFRPVREATCSQERSA